MRHVNYFFCVDLVKYGWRRCYFISNQIVNIICSHRAAKSHKLNLQRSGSQTKDIGTFALCPPVEVEQNMNVLWVDERSQLSHVHFLIMNLIKLVTSLLNILPVHRAVVWAQAKGNYLKLLPIVQTKYWLQKMSQRMVCKVPRYITDPQFKYSTHFLVTESRNWNALWLQSQDCLFQSVLRVESCNL